MADNRRAGVLRWGDEEKRMVRHYLNQGRIDAGRMGDVAYLRSLMDLEAVWSRHPPRNFYQNIRRAVDVWQANEMATGARRNNPAPPADGDGMADDDDAGGA